MQLHHCPGQSSIRLLLLQDFHLFIVRQVSILELVLGLLDLQEVLHHEPIQFFVVFQDLQPIYVVGRVNELVERVFLIEHGGDMVFKELIMLENLLVRVNDQRAAS